MASAFRGCLTRWLVGVGPQSIPQAKLTTNSGSHSQQKRSISRYTEQKYHKMMAEDAPKKKFAPSKLRKALLIGTSVERQAAYAQSLKQSKSLPRFVRGLDLEDWIAKGDAHKIKKIAEGQLKRPGLKRAVLQYSALRWVQIQHPGADNNIAMILEGAETQIRQSVYSAVVVLYSKMRLDKQASYTMTLMRKANLTPSLHAYNMLLQLLVKLKSNDKIGRLYEDMKARGVLPNSETYRLMWLAHPKPTQAKLLWREMRQRQLKGTTAIHALLIEAADTPDELQQIIEDMRAAHQKYNEQIISALMKTYLRFGDVENAFALLPIADALLTPADIIDRIRRPRPHHVLVEECSRLGLLEPAANAWVHMTMLKIPLTDASVIAVARVLPTSERISSVWERVRNMSGLVKNEKVIRSFIQAGARVESLVLINRIFYDIRQANMKVSEHVYMEFLEAYRIVKQFRLMYSTIQIMLAKGMKLTEEMFLMLIEPLSQAGHLRVAYLIVAEMRKHVRPTSATVAALLSTWKRSLTASNTSDETIQQIEKLFSPEFEVDQIINDSFDHLNVLLSNGTLKTSEGDLVFAPQRVNKEKK